MTTVADLIARARRDWLEPPDDIPPTTVLTSDVTAGDDTIPFNPTLLGPVLDTIGAGQVVEVGMELMTVVDVGTASFTVLRHRQETEAVAHLAGDELTLPRWSRRTLFDAICDAIENLWPEVWDKRTLRVLPNLEHMAAPAGLMDVLTTDAYWEPNHPLGPNGRLTLNCEDEYIAYKHRYQRPTSETDSLEDKIGLTDRLLHRLIIVGAVADVIQGRDLSATTVEFVTKALEAQSVPVGTGIDIRNALLSYEDHLRSRAIDRLMVEDSITVVRMPVW